MRRLELESIHRTGPSRSFQSQWPHWVFFLLLFIEKKDLENDWNPRQNVFLIEAGFFFFSDDVVASDFVGKKTTTTRLIPLDGQRLANWNRLRSAHRGQSKRNQTKKTKRRGRPLKPMAIDFQGPKRERERERERELCLISESELVRVSWQRFRRCNLGDKRVEYDGE